MNFVGDKCLFGKKIKYLRRKRDAKCFNPEEAQRTSILFDLNSKWVWRVAPVLMKIGSVTLDSTERFREGIVSQCQRDLAALSKLNPPRIAKAPIKRLKVTKRFLGINVRVVSIWDQLMFHAQERSPSKKRNHRSKTHRLQSHQTGSLKLTLSRRQPWIILPSRKVKVRCFYHLDTKPKQES